MRPLDECNLRYFEGMRVLSALAFVGELGPGSNNAWNTPHTLGALYRHFERITGVHVRV